MGCCGRTRVKLIIRGATIADAPALLALWRAADAEPTHTDNARSISVLLERDPQSVIVAERDAAIVGSVVAAWDGWRGFIYRLVVAPAEQRRGLGTRLLRAAE